MMEQEFDRDSLHLLRTAVADRAPQLGLEPGRAGDLVLVAHELAANAVLHGAGHGQLRIWADGPAVHCEVTDDGPPDGPRAAAPRRGDPPGTGPAGAPARPAGQPAAGARGAAGPPPARGTASPPAPGRPGSPPWDPAPWPVRHGHGLWVVGQLVDRASLHSGPGGTTAAIRLASGPAAP
jgi:anti-sigma regulatory factor (Ser/Thr protein kinase)